MRVVCLGALFALGCHAPTLWVGTALAPDGGAAGEGRADQQPATAGTGGRSAEAEEEDVALRPGAGADAGLQPRAAGRVGAAAALDAGIHSSTPSSRDDPESAGDQDEDAGKEPEPDDRPEVLTPTKLPSIEGQCPNINGPGTYMFSGGSRSLMVDIYMRADAKSLPAPGGPLILYFHSLGGAANEVTKALGQSAIDTVVAQGGVVASFTASTCLRCGLADDVVWYDEDDAVSDQVLACVTQKAQIDLRRIHSVGFSSGALHSMHLALARSNYIASVVSYSGGLPAGSLEPQDPTNKVPALLSYGREGVDNAIVDFNIASRDWYEKFSARGYYTLLCDHQRGHEIPEELTPHILRFLTDHPYQTTPDPYATTIPTEYPSYCHNTPQ